MYLGYSIIVLSVVCDSGNIYIYDLTVVEFYIYIALLYYIAIVDLPILKHYLSAQYFIFQWNWARAFMSKNMFRQIGSSMNTAIIKLKNTDDKRRIYVALQWVWSQC